MSHVPNAPVSVTDGGFNGHPAKSPEVLSQHIPHRTLKVHSFAQYIYYLPGST